jgi:hypothetical protein
MSGIYEGDEELREALQRYYKNIDSITGGVERAPVQGSPASSLSGDGTYGKVIKEGLYGKVGHPVFISTRPISQQDVQKAYYNAGKVERDIRHYLYYLDITLKDLSNALSAGNEELVVVLYANLQDIRQALISREYFNMTSVAHVE